MKTTIATTETVHLSRKLTQSRESGSSGHWRPRRVRFAPRRLLVTSCLIASACSGKTPPPTGSPALVDQKGADGDREEEEEAPGTECQLDSECFPYSARHATWCSPFDETARTTGANEAVVDGTLDGTPPEVGCRCSNGWCGALLNSGELVVGPQPDPPGVEYASECAADSDCYPQNAGHSSWCGPHERDFGERVVEAVFVPRTTDEGDCACFSGRCGLQFEQGPAVIGPQKALYRPVPG